MHDFIKLFNLQGRILQIRDILVRQMRLQLRYLHFLQLHHL